MHYLLLFAVLIFAGCKDLVKEKDKKNAVNQINSKINILRNDGFSINGLIIEEKLSAADKSTSKSKIGHIYAKNVTLSNNLIESSDMYLVYDVKFDFKATFFKQARPNYGQMSVSIVYSVEERKWHLKKFEVQSLERRHNTSLKERILNERLSEYRSLKTFDDDMIKYIFQKSIKEIEKIKHEESVWIELKKFELQTDVVGFFTE